MTTIAAVVADHLRAAGFRAEPTDDDVVHAPHVVIVAREQWQARRHLGALVDRAEDIAADTADEAVIPAVWQERTGRAHPDDWLVTVTGDVFRQLLTAHTIVAQMFPSADHDDDIRYGIAPCVADRCLAPAAGGTVCLAPAGHDPAHQPAGAR